MIIKIRITEEHIKNGTTDSESDAIALAVNEALPKYKAFTGFGVVELHLIEDNRQVVYLHLPEAIQHIPHDIVNDKSFDPVEFEIDVPDHCL